jgi:hypothetical protein
MRRTLTTTALLLALSCPAFAGEMHTPVAAPTPAPSSAPEPSMTNGEPETEAADDLMQAALSLLQSVLALL